MILIDGESEIQELQLAVVPVQQIPARRAIFSRAPHVLAQAIQHGAFIGIAFGVIAVAVADVVLERGYPVNLVCLLEGAGQHGSLSHFPAGGGPAERPTSRGRWSSAGGGWQREKR
jgi:hypothetical protein